MLEPTTIPKRIADHAVTNPRAPAISWESEITDYVTLFGRAAVIADRLSAAGVRAGDTVVVRVGPGRDRYAAALGTMFSGARLLWFSTADAGARGKTIVEDMAPTCILVDDVAADDDLVSWFRTREVGQVVALPAGVVSDVAGDVDPRADAYVAYTSGSTGTPKAIAQTHAALAQFSAWLGPELGIGPGSRVAQWVTPEHDPAIAEVGATVAAGGCLVPVPERARIDPRRLARWLVDNAITHLQIVPSMARGIADAVVEADTTADELCSIALMGETATAAVVRRLREAFPHASLTNVYGPTETIAATWYRMSGKELGVVPVGTEIPGREVLVIDPADRPCATGETGEIVVRTPFVTPGYVGSAGDGAPFRPLRPGATTQQQPTYRTGDLGRWNDQGLLEIVGRKDHQIKLLGNRLELGEIERTLDDDPSVVECAAVPVANGDGQVTGVTAHIRATGAPDKPGWRDGLRRRFGFRLPVTFHVHTDPLPRTVAGKIDRPRLATGNAALRSGPAE